MIIKILTAAFFFLFLLVANASLPEHIGKLVFDRSGFKNFIGINVPLEDNQKTFDNVRTTDYGVLTIKPPLSSNRIDRIFLHYLVSNKYAEIIMEEWKSRGTRDPMYFLFYTDEFFQELSDVEECNRGWCLNIGNRELVSIDYTNSYKGNVYGYETDVFAVVFKYKINILLPGIDDDPRLFTGKAKAYLNLDDGTWKLMNFELEDKKDQSILDYISNVYQEFDFSVENELIKSVAIEAHLQPGNASASIDENKSDPIEIFNQAMSSIDQKNHDEAISLFSQAIESEELTWIDKLIAYMKRGEAYEKLQLYKQAINDYSTALQKLESREGLNDYKAEFYYRSGYLNEKIDNKQQALEDYSSAIQNDKDYLRAYNNRANLFFEIEDYENSIKDLDRYIEGDKQGWPQAYHLRGIAKLILEQHDESVKDLRIAASLGYQDAQITLDKKNIKWQGADSIYRINDVLAECGDTPEHSIRIVVILAKNTGQMKSLKALGILNEKILVVSNDSIMEGLSNGDLILNDREFNLKIGSQETNELIKTISGIGLAYDDLNSDITEIFVDVSFDHDDKKIDWDVASQFSVAKGKCMILNLVDLQIEEELDVKDGVSNITIVASPFNLDSVPKAYDTPVHFENPSIAFESVLDQGLIEIIKQSSETTLGKCRAELAKHIWSLEKFELVELATSIFANQLSISSLDDVMADKLETDLLLELSRIILDQPQSIDQIESFMDSVIGYLMANVITISYIDGIELNEYLDVEITADLTTTFNLILEQEEIQYFEIKNLMRSEKSKYQATQNDLDISSAKLFYNPYSRYLLVVVDATCENTDESVYVFMAEVEKFISKAIPVANSFKALEF